MGKENRERKSQRLINPLTKFPYPENIVTKLFTFWGASSNQVIKIRSIEALLDKFPATVYRRQVVTICK